MVTPERLSNADLIPLFHSLFVNKSLDPMPILHLPPYRLDLLQDLLVGQQALSLLS